MKDTGRFIAWTARTSHGSCVAGSGHTTPMHTPFWEGELADLLAGGAAAQLRISCCLGAG